MGKELISYSHVISRTKPVLRESFEILYEYTNQKFLTAVVVVTRMIGSFLNMTYMLMSVFTFQANGVH
jgi:hypothetical protein